MFSSLLIVQATAVDEDEEIMAGTGLLGQQLQRLKLLICHSGTGLYEKRYQTNL
jgi:hypothetical protein